MVQRVSLPMLMVTAAALLLACAQPTPMPTAAPSHVAADVDSEPSPISWEGMPLGSSRNPFSHSSLDLPIAPALPSHPHRR